MKFRDFSEVAISYLPDSKDCHYLSDLTCGCSPLPPFGTSMPWSMTVWNLAHLKFRCYGAEHSPLDLR